VPVNVFVELAVPIWSWPTSAWVFFAERKTWKEKTEREVNNSKIPTESNKDRRIRSFFILISE